MAVGCIVSASLSEVQAAGTRITRPAPPPAIRVEHVVKQGETLWSIASRFNVPVLQIRKANGLGADVQPAAGSRLVVPVAWARNAAGEPAKKDESLGPSDVGLAGSSLDEGDEGAGETGVDALSLTGRKDLADPELVSVLKRGAFMWPVKGQVISRFGKRRRRHHTGLDIKASSGTPIRAAMAGKVVFAGTIRGHGRVIVLEHAGGWHSVYSHNQKNLVCCEAGEGPAVRAGQVIGLVGRSGNASTAHLHFEIRHFEKPIDPLPFLRLQIPAFATASGGRGDPGSEGI